MIGMNMGSGAPVHHPEWGLEALVDRLLEGEARRIMAGDGEPEMQAEGISADVVEILGLVIRR